MPLGTRRRSAPASGLGRERLGGPHRARPRRRRPCRATRRAPPDSPQTACARSRTAAPARRDGSGCSSATSAVRERRGLDHDDPCRRARESRRRRYYACRARSAASRSRQAGWRRAAAGSRCGRRRGTGCCSCAPNIRPADDVLGHLVDGAGGEDVAACRAPSGRRVRSTERLECCARWGCRGRRRRRRARRSSRIGPRRLIDLGEGLVPARLDELAPSRLISGVRTRSGSSCS